MIDELIEKISQGQDFGRLFLELPSLRERHSPLNKEYQKWKAAARRGAEKLFSSTTPIPRDFGPFGSLTLPYFQMGHIDSINLFDLDELIIFSFYWKNRKRYKNVLDVGANIGLHSIILDKCGYKVKAYEPDPQHYQALQRNLRLNDRHNIQAFNKAVSSAEGEMEFVRVMGNTTGSHLAGSKASPYGELERFPVKLESILNIIGWADLMKLDAEGHEKHILLATGKEAWEKTDSIVEVENEKNAVSIFEYFRELKVNLFAQKINWQKVRKAEDMPNSYKEGSLFISCKKEMPWDEKRTMA